MATGIKTDPDKKQDWDRVRIFILLRSPGIESLESIPGLLKTLKILFMEN
jgi:hypothetical protein